MNAPAPSNPCSAVRDLASRYLDGRLSAPSRARVHAHLKECGDCLETYRSLQRLSTLARALPRADVPADLARRVRRTVSERRQQTLAHLQLDEAPLAPAKDRAALRLPWRGIAAAAVLVASCSAALFAGYKLGRQDERGETDQLIADLREDRDRFAELAINQGRDGVPPAPRAPRGDLADAPERARTPLVQEIDPGILQPYREKGFQPEHFVRSAHSLWSDLRSFDQLDPEVRRPLLSAQLSCFDLPSQVAIYDQLASTGAPQSDELAEVIAFVRRLSQQLERSTDELVPSRLLGSADPFAALPVSLVEAVPPSRTRIADERIEEILRASGETNPSVLERVRSAMAVKQAFVGGEMNSDLQSTLIIQIVRTEQTNVRRVFENGKEVRREESSTSSTQQVTGGTEH
ncbi:MAG: zf-HC2 domain-containing protein [Planctomycetes bacterium]|nr:zf-HC2 domain-containing protein [Planctomycetota bacterium]